MTTASPDEVERPDFREIQYQFTKHLRDPELNPAPADIEDRRMQIYRDLLYNNVEDFLGNTFPVLRKIIADDDWHRLMREYYSTHQSRTPLFPKMSQEFLQYLDQERGERTEDFPFMKELAHYEWLELAISIDSRDLDFDGVNESGDMIEARPVLSPLAWPFSYVYPVHRISPEFLPTEAPEAATYLVVYRDRHDEVGFLELNPVSARLIEYLQTDSSLSGREIMNKIAMEIQHPDASVVIEGGRQILASMHKLDIVLGTHSI